MGQHSEILDMPIEEQKQLPLYSSVSIALFTFFFTPIFGGVLAYQNLVRVGKKDIAVKTVIACFAWVFISSITAAQGSIPVVFMLVVKAGVAFVFGHRINDKYIPGHQKMPKRKIWVPLAIGLVIAIIILGLAVFGVDIPDQQ